MKRRVTERILVLILSIAVMLSSTGIYTVFATQENTAGSTTVTDSSTVADETTSVDPDTDENIVEGGGSIENATLAGDGTVENPYCIADVDDLFLMQGIINDSTKADKNFSLVADIDLSGVTASDLGKNTVTPGTLISLDKTLSDATPKSVWFNLNGCGFKIYGLNVTSTEFENVAIFGYISKNSTIKNVVVESCSITVKNDKAASSAVLALSNDGTIRNSTIKNAVFNVASADKAAVFGAIVAKNAGTVSNVTVDNIKVSVACSTNSVGAVAGINNGNISEIKATGVSIVTSEGNKSDYAGAVAGVNNSKIKDCVISVSALDYAMQSGGIAGINAGEINNCSVNGNCDGVSVASKSTATVATKGISGGIAGKNSGKIKNSTVNGISAYVDGGVYGGIAGVLAKGGAVSDCVATGVAGGNGVTGGIAGKAEEDSSVKNSYAFVTLSADSARGAVIGEGEAYLENNFWSSEISNRCIADESGSKQGNMLQSTRIITLHAGGSKTVNLLALGSSWGSASLVADSIDSVKVAGSAVEIKKGEKDFTLKATVANKTAKLTYSAKITVNSGYNNATVVARNMFVSVITLAKEATGDGLTVKTPIKISNSNELEFIKAAPFACFELAGDIDVPENWQPIRFSGYLNGTGFTLDTDSTLFSQVCGSISNLTVRLNGEIKTAMFGDANAAQFNNVRIIKGSVEEGSQKSVRLAAEESSVAPFLNKVMGNTVINSCYAEIPVHITKEGVNNVAGFVAVVDANGAKLESSGASVTITSEYEGKVADSAAFIGRVENNAEGVINGCFATLNSAVVDYALIGSGNKDSFKAENNYLSSINDKACPDDLDNVVASKWMFDAGEQGFIAGKGSVVSIALPAGVALFNNVKPEDFVAVYDSNKLKVNVSGITVKDGVLYLPVEAAEGVITVLNSEVTLVHKPTGLKSTIGVSNGLEQDKDGNYLVYYAVDIAFIGENLEKFSGESFKLVNDIDMSKLADFKPVGGTSASFNGKFDGCGHTISGLVVNGTSKAGLFGTLENATVTNLVIDGTDVKASGSYAGVLAGQISGNTVISKVTIKNSKVSAKESFAGVLAGSVNGDNVAVSDVNIQVAEISALNYAGGVTGNVEGNLKVTKSLVTQINASATGFVGGVAGSANALYADSVKVRMSQLTAEKFAGGVAGAFAGEIKSVQVNDSTVTGEIAGGLVGSTISETKAIVTDSRSASMNVNGADEAIALGGFIGSVVEGSSAEITNSVVTGGVGVNASTASGGFIGDVQGEAKISGSSTYAHIKGYESATRLPVGAGGVIGKVSCADLSAVSINKVNVGGSVTGYDFVGGIIGNILSEKAETVAVSDCVIGAKISSTEAENSAIIIGNINGEFVEAAVKNVIMSSYGMSLGAYSDSIGQSTYTDLDKLVESSLNEVIRTSDELAVNVKTDKVTELGFVFDESAGWQSESNERVTVISSSENKVVISANKSSMCAVVATYKLSSDSNITLKVHFDVESDIRLDLEGEGTASQPYRISNGFELDAIRDYIGENVHFVLVNDIEFTDADFAFGGNFYNQGNGFAPIGTEEATFNGIFDGAGYSISGLCINNAESSLFGIVKNAEISNVNINLTASGAELSAGVAAKAIDTVINNVTVSGEITVSSETGSLAAIAAFANGCELSNIVVKNLTVSTPETISANGVVYAAGVVARAVESSLSDIQVSETVTVNSASYAGGIIGYSENAVIKDVASKAVVNGDFAGGIVANAGTTTVADAIVDGVINGGSVAGGIASVANAAIKISDAVISATVDGETGGIVVGVAEKHIYSAENSDVEFKNIMYSSYQNSSDLFGQSELNSYQISACADTFIDVNNVESADGEFVAVGKDALKIKDAVEMLFNAQGNCAEFSVNGIEFKLSNVTTQPENLVSFDGESVVATATEFDEAELILTYSNGIETAVDMISVVGMTGEGTEENPYLISSEDTLKLLSVYPSAEFALSSDVTLNGEWLPVSGFSGKLNGNGFTVSGLKVKAENAGLFESLTSSAEISNVTFDSAVIEGGKNAGVVAATITGDVKINNVTVSASSVKADECGSAVAAVVNSDSASISSCAVTGCNVEANNAAGVVSVAEGSGLVIDSCSVTADITGENAGMLVAVSESELTVTNCLAGGTAKSQYAESGIIAVVTKELTGAMLVSDNEVSTELSGEAKHSASVVGVFEVLPQDDETFAKMFNNNTVTNGADSFQREVMQYQNFDGNEIPPEAEISFKGEGTQEAPYEIYTISELDSIPDGTDAYFVLMNDIEITADDYGIYIDAEGNTVYGALYCGYTPVKDFAGSFDGNGHVIKNLYINSEEDYVGLFANIKAQGQVKNVHLEILDDSQGYGFSSIRGASFVGGIAGYCESVNGIVNCTVEGGSVSGERAVGAIVGELASSKVVNCVSMTTVKSQKTAGGLVGVAKGDCSIENSVTATTVDVAGGTIVGINEGRLTVSDILSTGSSKCDNSITVGANNGELTIEKAVIGGTNAGATANAVDADEMSYVYSDVTALGTTDKGVTSVSAGNLIATLPEGLDGWVTADGNYPAPAMADDYAVSLVSLASVPVMADVKEGSDVVNGFAYPVSIGTDKVKLKTSTLSGEDDLYIEGNKVYNDVFSGEMPYVMVSSGDYSRVILLPQRFEENTLYLSLAKHLKALAEPYGKYSVFEDYLDNPQAKIILTANIDFAANSFSEENAIAPITGYTGDFDGNGYAINNVRINNSKGETGLFATVGGNSENIAEFKDITFNNVYITGCAETGTLAGVANEYTAIENVRIENDSEASYVSGLTAGAVVGSMLGGTVNNSYANINVDGENIVGGLIGKSDAVITNSNTNGKLNALISDSSLAGVGGLVGVMNSGAIYTSSSLADVFVTEIKNSADNNSVAGVGGLVGIANGREIKNTFSAGSVKVADAGVADGESVVGIGGLVGVAYAEVESVYSTSAVTADFTGGAEGEALRAAGGLVGVAYADVKDAYAAGGVSAISAGVRVYGSDCFKAGVVGYAFGDAYENLYFDKYMNNDENLTAVSNIISESCYRLTTNELVSGADISDAFGLSAETYPYLKAMVNNANADSQLNSALSVIITTPSETDESVKVGAGVSEAVTLPAEVMLGGKAYALKWSANESAVVDGQSAQLNRTKLYADYMSLTVSCGDVSKTYDRLYNDVGTVEATLGNTNVEYTLINESGDKYMDSALVGVLIKSRLGDNSVVTSDIFTSCDAQPAKMNKLLVTAGGFYVDASLEQGYDIVVKAKDHAGNEIEVTDAGAQGTFVETTKSDSVVLEITIVEKDIPWGLTSLWENLAR
ncbi:MAG: hypothetical protein IJZ88_04735 [Clostridia bacterium]|nr:hypothetical protein [Clostridia bacterium]